jgi:transcription termination factor Rho
MNIAELEKNTIAELHELAKDFEITGYSRLKKKELIFELLKDRIYFDLKNRQNNHF